MNTDLSQCHDSTINLNSSYHSDDDVPLNDQPQRSSTHVSPSSSMSQATTQPDTSDRDERT